MFKLVKIENGRMNVPEPEYLIAGAELKAGQAVALSGGVLVGSATPTHITLAKAAAGAKVPCTRIEPNQVYEVETSVIPTAKVGEKVAVQTEFIKVVGTASDTGATVVSLENAKAAGDKILVRF